MSNKYSNLTGHQLFIKSFFSTAFILEFLLCSLLTTTCPIHLHPQLLIQTREKENSIYQMPDPFLTSFLVKTLWSLIISISQMTSGALTQTSSHWFHSLAAREARPGVDSLKQRAQIDKSSCWKVLSCHIEWWQRNLKSGINSLPKLFPITHQHCKKHIACYHLI